MVSFKPNVLWDRFQICIDGAKPEREQLFQVPWYVVVWPIGLCIKLVMLKTAAAKLQ